jgi:F-type H+-transporting ATPase subunit c
MDAEAAKLVGAGLAAIGAGMAAIGVGNVFGSFLESAPSCSACWRSSLP